MISKHFPWKPALDDRIPKIQEQHLKFIGTIEAIYSALERDPVSAEELRARFAQLMQYVLKHFCVEEGYFMQLPEYETKEAHVREHRLFQSHVEEIMERSKDSNVNIVALAYEVADFSVSWLSNHILNVDQKLPVHPLE